MFLHLLTDEKFIDGAITRFNQNDPGHHTFLMIHGEEFSGFRYIKQSGSVQTIPAGSEKYKEYLSKLPAYDAVFVHSLFNPYNVAMINNASLDTVFVWLFWGGELWSFKEMRFKMMLPSTLRLYRRNTMKRWLRANTRKYVFLLKQQRFGDIFTNFLKKAYSRNPGETTDGSVALEKAIRRMDYVIPVVRDDFRVLEEYFHLQAEVLDWNYSAGISLETFGDKTAHGGNFLVGNSAHYSNNHLEIFHLLRKIKDFDGSIIVPLSYGDSEYKKCIIQAGRKMFSEGFMPLETFLPAKEYFSILESCSCAFFNTVRQQALGNIAVLLYQGTKVFLREENPLYHFFKRSGVMLFSIQRDLVRANNAVFEPMAEKDVIQNRSIVKSLFSEDMLNIKTQNLLIVLTRNSCS